LHIDASGVNRDLFLRVVCLFATPHGGVDNAAQDYILPSAGLHPALQPQIAILLAD
jgi:hypothetical protein